MKASLKRWIFRVYSQVFKTCLFIRCHWFPCGAPINQKQDAYNAIFIVGSGRSGNTLLRRILNKHEDLYIPPETYVLGKTIGQWTFQPWRSREKLQEILYKNLKNHNEFNTFGFQNPEVLKACLMEDKNLTLADTLCAFYSCYQEEHHLSGKYWVDKTPLNTLYIFQIKQVFPSAKFIVMQRDPSDTIASYLTSGIYSDFEEAALRWFDSARTISKFHCKYPENVFIVNYESLVTKPEQITRNVCDFLQIRFEPDMLSNDDSEYPLGDVETHKHHANVTQPIKSSSIGKGKTQLTEAQLRYIDKLKAKLPGYGA